MSRLSVVEASFYASVDRHEKKQQDGKSVAIPEWSINNVRRLFFGRDYVVVEHHVKLAKMPMIRTSIPLKGSMDEDFMALSSGGKVPPLSTLLTSGRVMSSIEEIVICTSGYPESLFMHDVSRLLNEVANENRFPRLTSIFALECGILELKELFPKAIEPTETLYEKAKASGVGLRLIKSFDNPNWVSRTALRGNYYLPDRGKLKQHFDDLKAKQVVSEREGKLLELDAKRVADHHGKYYPTLLNTIRSIHLILGESQSIFNASPVISKAEWGKYFSQDYFKRVMNMFPTLFISDDLNIRRVDFDTLYAVMRANGADEVGVESIDEIRSLFFDVILDANHQSYTLESNKYDALESYKALGRILDRVFNVLMDMVYHGYVRFVARGGKKLIPHYFSMLPDCVGIHYTVTMSEVVNTLIGGKTDYDAGYVFSNTSAVLVPVAEMTRQVKFSDAKRILSGLKLLL